MKIVEPKCNQCNNKGTIYAVDPYKEATLSEAEKEHLEAIWWCERHYIERLQEKYNEQ